MGWLATATLAIAVTVAYPCLGLNGPFHPGWQRQSRAYQAQRAAPARAYPYQAPRGQGARPPQGRPPARPQRGGHAGDWLRHYKDMPPAEQERALQNDPGFRRLPPAQQQQLRQRLQHFSNLPPQQQLRMLNRMETWEHLTPQQKYQARQIFGQIRALPPGRQRAVGTAIHALRGMPPEQREQVIDSDRFRGMFSDQEREMMRGATRLPLAPAEEAGPQE